MARITDNNKIEKIKTATLELVVQKGFGGASISEIAKLAGVAEGYLYSHYKGKTELVSELLYNNVNDIIEKLETLLAHGQTISEIIEQLVRLFIETANSNPEKIKFLFVLMHDYSFSIQESQRARIFDLCKRVKEKGLKSGELRSDIDEEEIYLIAVAYPIQFINLRFKSFFYNSQIGENEVSKILKICLNLIK